MFICIGNPSEDRAKLLELIRQFRRLLDVKSICENELHSNNHQFIVRKFNYKIPFTKQQIFADN